MPPAEKESGAQALVVGGGVAGLACATALAEAGHAVTLLEARSILGGRSTTWLEPRTGQPLDNGPHLVAGAYRELGRYLRRVGAGRANGRVSRPVILVSRNRDRVARLGRGPGRLALAADLLSYSPLSWRERAGVGRVLLAANGSVEPDRTLAAWLGELGQREAARRWLWDPMASAIFNDRPERISARLFAAVVERLFLRGRDAFVLSYPVPSLGESLLEPAADYLRARGAQIVLGARARAIERDGASYVALDHEGKAWRAELVCLAVPARAAAAILGPSAAAVSSQLPAAAATATTPLVSVALWFAGDGPRLAHDFFGIVEGEFGWVFDRRRLLGGAPDEPIVLVAPGAERIAALPAAEIVERAWETLARASDGADRRGLRGARVVKEPHAAPVLSPESAARRPSARGAWPGLALAGDWTDTGLPATLEGAAASGHRAAAVLRAFATNGAWYLPSSP